MPLLADKAINCMWLANNNANSSATVICLMCVIEAVILPQMHVITSKSF